MRSKVLGFLLVASLALNLFFVAGVIWPHLVIWPRLMGDPHPPHFSDPVADAAEDFSLDDRQVAALTDLRQRLAERREASRGERDGFQKLIVDALRQPAFDRAALSQTLEQRRDGMGDLILEMTEDLHGFLAGLTPDQKAAFLERAERERDFLRRLLFPPRPEGGRPPR
jgi:uncharacterized membrane protein